MTQLNKPVKSETSVIEYEADGQHVKLSSDIIIRQFDPKRQLSLQEVTYFMALCQARKLNPFTKEIYAIKYKSENPAQFVVSKDAILKRAVLHPDYNGKESGVIVKNLETGKKEYKEGTYYDEEEEKLVGGWCRVYRKNIDKPEFSAVKLSEVDKKQSVWLSSPATMVEKVAKVRALREAFVEDFAGMYEEDEIKEIPVITPDPFVQEVPAKPVEPVSEENEIDINAL